MKKENKKNNDKTNECVQNSTNINWEERILEKLRKTIEK